MIPSKRKQPIEQKIMKKSPLQHGFTLIELLVVITIIAILAGIALPVYSTIQERGQQTKALANAKQVGLALRLFAGDNSGAYPGSGIEDNAIENSNEAFRELIPGYVDSEKIFHYKVVPWAAGPDEDTSDGKVLEAGENMWAFVTNLTDTSKSTAPLMMDATATEGSAEWDTEDETAIGGVWKGTKAIVIFNDQSGQLITTGKNQNPRIEDGKLQTKDGDVYIDEFLGTNNKIVNPEL